MKKMAFMLAEIVMCNCPTSTPTSKTPVTEPKLNLPSLIFPIKKPNAKVKKTAISG